MAKKVVQGDGIFFKDEIKIIDAELVAPLNLPNDVPVFSRDELQVCYNGHVFVAENVDVKDDFVKVYRVTFALRETDSPKVQEDAYFAKHAKDIDKLKADFIEKVVNGVSIDPAVKAVLGAQISAELIERITQQYADCFTPGPMVAAPGRDRIAVAHDTSIFNACLKDKNRMLLLDGKVYLLETISEYVSHFQSAFEKGFYKAVQAAIPNATPEELSDLLTKNADKVHRKALPLVKNKIWHSDRSFKLFLDGMYWLPEFQGKVDDVVTKYKKGLERKVKVDAAHDYR